MTAPKPSTVDEYITGFPEPVQAILQTLRQTIRDEIPDVTETISYGMPTYKLGGNLVYFAAWKKHVSLYPTTPAMEAEIAELAAYAASGKVTIQFPYDKPLPLALVRKVVQFRIKELAQGQKK